MRGQFQEDLDGVRNTLVEMAGRVKVAMENTTTALLTADLALAEKVIAEDAIIDEIQHELDARTINLIARQSPVATDLRILISSLRMSADLERMGDLADHVAKLARMRYPATAVPPELALTIEEMGRVCVKIVEKTALVVSNRDAQLAQEIEKDDDEIDALHRKIIQTLLEPGWAHGIETAIDMTLLGRYYERCADHAVSIARRIEFLVTGQFTRKS
ncbi:MAG: phosphate transport system regulatory protein PhoU [Actinobacteria bacterium]|nr:phosphate transport system regulatory protein PhoU [Actinomycetota bacterium]NCA26057.1 phosphate signaling complex protein PhoU [Actinomycetota bacterium]NCU78804.1 phosphate transport system regulatory protein PhoU [Actinomycetota bacterium]NCZ76960.1 phosphate transport system regulatory protein PhoU [Actinomycetota bacterium]